MDLKNNREREVSIHAYDQAMDEMAKALTQAMWDTPTEHHYAFIKMIEYVNLLVSGYKLQFKRNPRGATDITCKRTFQLESDHGE